MKSCVVIWFLRQQEIKELSSLPDYLCLVEGIVFLLYKKLFTEQGCICFVKIGECWWFVLFIFGVMDFECV